MSRRFSLELLAAAFLAAIGLWATLAWSCGPWFPNRLLVHGDEAVLWAPTADFRVEVEHLMPEEAGLCQAVEPTRESYWHPGYAKQTADADRAELRATLEGWSVWPARRDAILAEHARLREALCAQARRREEAAYDNPADAPLDPRIEVSPGLAAVTVPSNLPQEFAAYLRGAVAYYHRDLDEARSEWAAVLTLPAEERHYRSTWAAYMLGKSWLKGDPARAVEYFVQVRALAAEGFGDSTGLASSSLGWQARAELNRGNYEAATDLYLQHLASGDEGAVESLRRVARQIIKENQDNKDVLRRAAADEKTRRLVTAFLLARGGSRGATYAESVPVDLTEAWLDEVEAANVRDAAGADRLAWVAYQAGQMDTADRWLQRAPPDSPIAHWIRAKLLLRAGKTDEAAEHLAAASQGFPEDEVWEHPTDEFTDADEVDDSSQIAPAHRALAELGVLHLARRQYVESLDALLRTGWWLDAAYVAERVLTPDELAKYVDATWPAARAEIEEATLPRLREPVGPPSPVDQSLAGWWAYVRAYDELRALRVQGETNVRIRHLLARRLARANRWDQARPYFPRRHQADFDTYARNLRAGRNLALSQDEHAAALWQAARLARHKGMELLGSELEPDWSALDGEYEIDAVSQTRAQPGSDRLNRASADELRRVRRQPIQPTRRWHYRYVATDLAWEAAGMMPDESDETARVLCEAGSWLKGHEPLLADRFYKALVRRCGKTGLGREAERLHWFPSVPNNDDER